MLLNAQVVLDKIDVLETPPESEHELDINTTYTTLQNVDQANLMLGAAIRDVISFDNAAMRLQNAYHTMVVENSLLKEQIEAMTAAAKQQAELSQSRRQVPQIIGEPRDSTVAGQRRAVQERAKRDAEKLQRKLDREQRKAAKKTEVKTRARKQPKQP